MAFTAAQAQPTKQTFHWQNEDREYYTFVPDSYDDGADTLPVMVFLHGFDGGIDTYIADIDFQQAADRFHWMIVLPEALSASIEFMGMSVPAGKAWNSGIVMTVMGSSFSPNNDVDDAGFLLALVDSLGISYRLHPDSLFFAGFSMGAFMAHRMAIEHGDRINGVAAASGLIPLCFADSIPIHPISILHIHGTADNIIAPDGTASPIPGMGQMTLGLSVDSTVNYWRRHNHCDGTPTVATYADIEDDGLLFTLHTYANGTDSTRVALLSVDGGQHKWYEEGHDVQYLTAIHDFFTKSNSYSLLGIDLPKRHSSLSVFPNPADDSIVVDSPIPSHLFIHSVDGRTLAVHQLLTGRNMLDISSLHAGIYLLHSTSGQQATLIIR